MFVAGIPAGFKRRGERQKTDSAITIIERKNGRRITLPTAIAWP
jgi:hypothetical protein